MLIPKFILFFKLNLNEIKGTLFNEPLLIIINCLDKLSYISEKIIKS